MIHPLLYKLLWILSNCLFLSCFFADQRTIIREVLGKEKAEKAVQVFIPYKEVLDLYNAGLDVPEDVTMIWANDNFGHMRRYPNKEELTRKGGHGLYFHNSYWAHPEMSYLFINSIPLAQTGNELEKAYNFPSTSRMIVR